ncbi:hypothetical protein QFZ37_002795 [Chryseobacterium ginsenosidimutans]|uniref:hypothetical protein n=1 Tax=Chryseobacterium ginsenosidimutans TaxID=687846 RepID=UPI00277FDA67|nr:hypothetical protein [Chryseobacterium ginsenosidimutans]MDQ0594426.1 hypothetical protein [Chryseobacterium ginsenosidimutans]
MIIGGQTIVNPTMDQSLQPSVLIPHQIIIAFYQNINVSVLTLIFSTIDNSFIKNDSACTLMDYWGANMTAVQGYNQKPATFMDILLVEVF